MRQQQKEHFTKQSSSISGQAYNVELSAKLFETVYGNMYRYKEAAVTRELLCNMIDAHEMRDRFYRTIPGYYTSVLSIPQARVSKYLAPKGTKPVVHLPDDLEPWLEMRDYGIGLSLEQIVGEAIPADIDEVLIQGNMIVKEDSIPEGATIIGEPGYYEGNLVFRSPENNEIIRGPGLYTTLFRSTKSEDDDMIGSFGLGSKSPFAVTDTFTVESRYEGKVHRFLMYLNSNRIPCCDMVTKDLETRDPKPDTTDEYNGLTVRVPIKNSEYGRFAAELKRIGMVMEESAWPEVENDRHFSGFVSIDRSNRINNTYIQADKNGTHFAVMGGVSYPIDTNQLPPHLANILSRFPTTYTFFGIGELNVPPSREDLDYGEYTRAALEKSLEELRDRVVGEAINDVMEANRNGPLFAYYTKMRFKDTYGDTFLTILNERVPADPRFNAKGQFYRPGYEPKVNRKYVESLEKYPVLIGDKDSFYRVQHFNTWQRDENYNMNIVDFHKKTPNIVIMDDPRAFTQKCKTLANRTLNDVILIIPDADMIKHRNSKLGKLYLNANEMRARIRKWAGTSKDMDYMAFADAFAEHFDQIVDAGSIKFTSELEYDRLVVDGNLGIMRVQFTKGRYGSRTFEGCELKSDAISRIADAGKRMVYVELSGHNVISEYNGEVMDADDVHYMWGYMKQMESLRSPVPEGERRAQPWYKDIGLDESLYLVRRKAVPFLKRNSEYFVSITEVIDEFRKEFHDMFQAVALEWFAEQGGSIRNTIGRLEYYQWIAQQLKDDKLYSKFNALQQKFMSSVVSAKTCGVARAQLIEGREDYYRNNKSAMTNFNEKFEAYKPSKEDDPYGALTYQDLRSQFYNITERLANHLGIDDDYLKPPTRGNRKSRGRVGNNRKEEVRAAIERHLIAQYVAASYKPAMGNKLLGKSQFMKTLLAEITPGQ
ncbi:RIIA lysis inhibitor [Serratia phage vB_SmaA_3M]|uniref:RIIA protein n=1 Tax=Serratia phage vB_SmaA_3M TaxID=2419930 RepID=A0A3G2YRL0_9CAUD|nr:RIIA lysis inhibitor [Serratia phage vB_SmaA_3M]AYP28259.1 RIIA protein [Serratia phage vB_SmaA_3M]